MRRFTQWLYYILLLAVLLLGLTFLIHEPQLVQRLRLAVFDTYQRLQPREYTPLPVKVIDVDERSLRELGQWPWPRTLADARRDTLHASLIEQALLGEFLYRPGWAEPMEYLYAAVLAVVLLLFLKRTNAIGTAIVGAITVAFATGLSWLSFVHWHWLVAPVLPSLGALLVYLVATMINYLRTETERKHVRDAFGHYLAPTVVEQLTSNPACSNSVARSVRRRFCSPTLRALRP